MNPMTVREISRLNSKDENNEHMVGVQLFTQAIYTTSAVVEEVSMIAVQGKGFETDSQRTTALWELVTADLMARKANSKTTTQTTSSSNTDTPTPGTPEFSRQVLLPRNIVIAPQPAAYDSFKHFNTSPPSLGENTFDHYRNIPSLAHSTVWLDYRNPAFQDEVVCNYKALHFQQPVEAEWVDDALRLLLKREPRTIDDTLPRCWVPVRLHEQSFSPTTSEAGGWWDAPPILAAEAECDRVPKFGFSNTPDCSYWIWTGGFSRSLRDELETYTTVRLRGQALCPYLSVELKRSDEPSAVRKAQHQIALAATIALYNRFQLHRRRLLYRRPSAAAVDDDILRHYGLTLTGLTWAIWCITPSCTNSDPCCWNGCNVRQIGKGVLNRPGSVEKLASWLNEIHRWGNTVHSVACMNDIKAVVRADRLAQRTSLLTDEIESLHLEDDNEEEEEEEEEEPVKYEARDTDYSDGNLNVTG
ncbi:hypothetical protein GTA08_BOTSDO04854 [Botryosphaeria dothidea]|uniref:Uncharacterized protein n=1 Tax=Botryosphaeria dothidea TaxID=55169 RepID=A0A8H4IUK0_9PEZI|nr:hypothetical protein GTA08_BOTSDO04857 [Botryosphaeria dothidea]KAF4306619.1 hypothetical protein GTA08_BOTSDO04854 [Botryosphaeria dothidea]